MYPPYKNVPAVDNKNPDVTGVVSIAQGDLTGVYNEDHSVKVYAGIPYAYGNLWRHPGLYSEEDYELSEIMQQYWVNFAKTGNPNGEGLPEWKMRTADQDKLLQLDTEIKMIDDPNAELYKIIDMYQESTIS